MPHWIGLMYFVSVWAFSGCVFQCAGEDADHPRVVRIPPVGTFAPDSIPMQEIEKRRAVAPDEECLERGQFNSIGAVHALFPSLDLERGMFLGSSASIEAVGEWVQEDALHIGAIVGHLEVFGPNSNVDELLRSMGDSPSLEVYGLPIPTWYKTKPSKGRVGHWESAPIIFSTTRNESRWALLFQNGTLAEELPHSPDAALIQDADRWTLKEFEHFPLFERIPLLQGTATVLRLAATNDPRVAYQGIVNFVVTAVELWRENESVGCAPSDR